MLRYHRLPSSGKKNKFVCLLVVGQLTHRLMQADISCTRTARLFFFPLLVDYDCSILHQLGTTLLILGRERSTSNGDGTRRGSLLSAPVYVPTVNPAATTKMRESESPDRRQDRTTPPPTTSALRKPSEVSSAEILPEPEIRNGSGFPN